MSIPSRNWLDHLHSTTDFAAAGDRRGQQWIENLPSLVRETCVHWTLEVDERSHRSGYHAVVLPVRRHGERCVLKLTWPSDRALDEIRALTTWNGRGAVRLLEADASQGAMLLERLNAQRTLHDLNPIEAAATAGRLLRRLAVPAPAGLPRLSDALHDIAVSFDERQRRLDQPIPEGLLDTARQHARQLAAITGNQLLIHGDLHYDNILAGDREPWLAIDPKPISGDPEYAVPELLWRRVDEIGDARGIRDILQVIVSNASLDAEKARSWAIVRSVDFWLWGIEHLLTDDPKRCQRIVEALI
jgi:streptomycin 6-kinase